MLTRKGALLLSALVLGAGVALVYQSWALALALAPPFAALLAAVALAGLREPALEVAHDVADRRRIAGDVTPAVLVVRNRGGSAGLCEIRIELPRTMAIAGGPPVMLARLPAGAEVRFGYDLSTPARGRYVTGDVRIRARGLLGLVQREWLASSPLALDVYPGAEPLPELPILARRHNVILGVHRAERVGAGSEFWSLRQYQPGDSMDVVNWKTTAKRGRPYVNEYEHESPADVVVVLDARSASNVGSGYQSTFEAGVRAVVSVAERALADRAKVGLVVLGERIVWVHPGSGKRQLDKIVTTLLDVPEGGAYDLGQVLPSAPPQVFPKGAQVVLVTPGHVDGSLPESVEGLRMRGLSVLVVAPDPAAVEVAAGVGGRLGPVAARVLSVGRKRFFDEARARGAIVVEWDVSEFLGVALARAMPGGRRA